MSTEDANDIVKKLIEEITTLEKKTTGMTFEEKQELKYLIEEIRKLWYE